MKFIKVFIETGYHTGASPEIIEVEDDATRAEMEEIARDAFFNQCSYGWAECDEEGNECD